MAPHTGSVTKLPTPPKSSFASDNVAGAHPLVLEAIAKANAGHVPAYGADPITVRTEQAFKELFDHDVVTQFAYGGTGANVFALASMLRPADAIVCAAQSHINVDETGAPERALGTKLITVPTIDAKLRPQDLESARSMFGNQHAPQPGIVAITQVTELGALYSVDEVRTLSEAAHSMGMFMYLDGARIANATAALGGTRETLRSFTRDAGIDAMTFGCTKAGGIFGEAVVFFNPEFAKRSLYVRKQVTQLHSKMRFISAQYEAMLQDDLFITLGGQANKSARMLFDKTKDIASLQLTSAPAANSMFPIIAKAMRAKLQEWAHFYDWDTAIDQVRWMTAWDVTEPEIDAFVTGVRALLASRHAFGSN
jgi:threonine aldolase